MVVAAIAVGLRWPATSVPVVRRAVGQETLEIERFRQRLQEADTWFVHAPERMGHSRHGSPMLRHNRYIRWDALRGIGTMESSPMGVRRWTWVEALVHGSGCS